MTNAWKLASALLIMATTCLAQAGLTVHSKGKHKWPAAEAERFMCRHAHSFSGTSVTVMRSCLQSRWSWAPIRT